jgi:glycosyltransferase involved in cell wall biosynthesis
MNTDTENSELDFFKTPIGAKAPTIMQVLPALNSGGVERGTLEISEALVSVGWNSIVVSEGGSMVKELTNNGGVHITLNVGSKNPLKWFKCYSRLQGIISAYDVDLIHARSRIPAWLSLGAATSTKTPFITTFHGRYRDTNSLKRLYNSVMTRGEKTIAISKYIAAEITKRHKLHPEKLYIIPRGVDLELFNKNSVSSDRTNELKDKWGIPKGIPIIMLPGRVTRWKGHELLIDSLSKLKDLPFFCIIVGPFDDKRDFKKSLEGRIAKNNLNSKITFAGDCSDMAAAYKLSNIVVSASLDPEPFGRVIIEAQAMGCLVIASNHGGASESIIDQKTGWLFKARDSFALSNTLRKVLHLSNNTKLKASNDAIMHIKANFSKKDMCMRTLSVYSEALGFSTTENYK